MTETEKIIAQRYGKPPETKTDDDRTISEIISNAIIKKCCNLNGFNDNNFLIENPEM